jgi:hypothetical protein
LKLKYNKLLSSLAINFNLRRYIKCSILEPSTAMRHAAELVAIIKARHSEVLPILFGITDGGPDHNTNFWSVRVTLIAIFLALDLDYLCFMRPAPCQSYRNPVERCFSLINVLLQCVSLARPSMSATCEKALSSCNSMADIRSACAANGDLRDAFAQSMRVGRGDYCSPPHRHMLLATS